MSTQSPLRLVQLNAENLFLFLDLYKGEDLTQISEREWQAMSYASVPNKSLTKTLWLAEALVDMQPDIILLNEVGGLDSLKNFNQYFLNDSYYVHLIEGNSSRGIDVGYLVRKSLPYKYMLNSHKNRPLHFLYPHEIEFNKLQTDESKKIRSHNFSRDALELRVFSANAQLYLIILLVHLKSKLDPEFIDPQGRERRAAELKTLVAIYNEIRSDETCPVVIAGDFNGNASSTQTDPEFLYLYQHTDLTDVLADKSLPDRTTQIQFLGKAPPQLLQLDYIFISPEIKKKNSFVYLYKNQKGIPLPLPSTLEQRNALPSDHFPVVADILLP